MASSERRQELSVFEVLVLVFALLFLFHCGIRFVSWFHRFSSLLPLVSLLAFSTSNALYGLWASESTAYGDRALEFAFSRLLIVSLVARFLHSYVSSSRSLFSPPPTAAPPEYQAPTASVVLGGEEQQGFALSARSAFLVLITVGALWGVEESLQADGEPFIGLVLAWLFLACKFRRRPWALGSVGGVLALVAGVLMAKSGQVTGWSALAGFLFACRYVLVDFVVRGGGGGGQDLQHRSELRLIWLPGAVATGVALLCFLLFAPPSSPSSSAAPGRGVLDCLGAAGLGALFSLGALLAAIEVIKTHSLLTMMAAYSVCEVLVRCLLAPLGGLPATFSPVILPLNITGAVLAALAFLVVVRHDPFAAANVALAKLFKFLEEEEEEDGEDGNADLGDDNGGEVRKVTTV